MGLGPKQVGAVNLFLNQATTNNIDTTFSVFYSLDERVQSKIVFGPPEIEKYAKEGSTAEDV